MKSERLCTLFLCTPPLQASTGMLISGVNTP
nr:MAG TPA: hypothetical protein [Caudoviricetes sp.]